jgi:hypothetical protein
MCYVTGGGPEAKCMRRPPLSRFVPSQKRGADPLPMLFVRIGVTGHGIVPHYRIDYFDEVDLFSKRLGNNSVCKTFGAFDGRTHKKIAVLEEASIQRDESILLDQNWSTRSTTFKEIENLLGQIRDIKKKSR